MICHGEAIPAFFSPMIYAMIRYPGKVAPSLHNVLDYELGVYLEKVKLLLLLTCGNAVSIK